jgi:hypothetical protein
MWRASLLVLLMTIGCGGASTPTGASPSTAAYLVILVPSLAPGDSDRSQALAFDAGKQPLGDVTTATSWTSLSPDVAVIDPDGVVHAIAPGNTTIQGKYQGATSSAPLTVFALSDLSLFFRGDSQRVARVGDSSDVSVYASATMGPATTSFDVSNRSTWTSTHPQRVRIDTPGHVTALDSGFANVIATYHGLRASLGVIVFPNSPSSNDVVTLPQFGGGISGFFQVGGRVSAFNDVSYTLSSAGSGRLVYQLVNQDLRSIGGNPGVDIVSGQGTIRMSDSLVIPSGTTAICYSALLFAGNAAPITTYYPGCFDLTRFQ